MRSSLANNVWFVGFAPMDKPEIAVVALFENGEESYNAVPIVRDVLKAYFDKKAREKNVAFQSAALNKLEPRLLFSLPVFANLDLLLARSPLE
jgi:Penicillin binding protein transpeptidase domain